jgi:thioesterase domain-containing protein/acyl carrier protein
MYRTGDWARLHPDGSLEYRGRRDRRVLRGGQRVQCEEIERMLLGHASVSAAAVLLSEATEQSKGGLAALVVVAAGQTVGEEELRGFLTERLPPAMIPKSIRQVEKILRTAQGKVILEQGEYVAPRTEVEQEMAQIWSELLEVERVSVYDDFFRLGGHSLLAVRLKTLLQERLNWEMPLADLFRAPTIAGLANLMARSAAEPVGTTDESGSSSSSSSSSSMVVEIQPGAGEAQAPIFLVHPVGGSVLCYVDLARELGAEQPVYALQSPGAGATEEMATLAQMAELYIKKIRKVQAAGPYSLGGWSLGGLLAWEMARQLAEQGETTGVLALIDSYPSSGAGLGDDPSEENQIANENANQIADESEDKIAESKMLLWFAQDMARMVGEDPDQLESTFRRLDGAGRWAAVEELLTRHGLAPRSSAQAETARLLEVFSRNVRAMESYPMRRAEQRVLLFAAENRPGSADALAAEWESWAGGGVEFHRMAGDHYSMMRRPQVGMIGRALRHALEEQPRSAGFLAPVIEPVSQTVKRNSF